MICNDHDSEENGSRSSRKLTVKCDPATSILIRQATTNQHEENCWRKKAHLREANPVRGFVQYDSHQPGESYRLDSIGEKPAASAKKVDV